MVNRSKPSGLSRRLHDVRRSSVYLENSILKSQNISLAKELSDFKQKYTNLFKENVMMTSKLFEVEALNSKLMEVVKRIDSYGKLGLSKLVGISEDMTQILQETARLMYTPKEFNHLAEVVLQRGKSNSRTRIVKPMVSGHTIISPTITLQRVTVEQLEQLRNGAITNNNVNCDETNSHSNGRVDANDSVTALSLEEDRVLSDGLADDSNDEIIENSYSNSENANRLNTLLEESLENVTQIGSGRHSKNTSNSLNSTGIQEARVNLSSLSKSATPTTEWNYSSPQSTNPTTSASRSSRNLTTEVYNPQVNLYQLPPTVLKNFSPLNTENVNETRFTNSSSKLSLKFLRVPSFRKEVKCSTTNSQESLQDVANDISILNDTTAKNSWTRLREDGIDPSNNDDDALEENLNVSTLVNLSSETVRLSDNFESVEDLTHSNIVKGAIKQQEILANKNEKNQSSDTLRSNASVEVTHESDALTSRSNKLSKDLTSQAKSTVLMPIENRKFHGYTSSYDPLEGPSTLLDNTETLEEKFLLLYNLGLSAVNNTSTPYTPPKVTIRRKRDYRLHTPPTPLLHSRALRKGVLLEKSSPINSLKMEEHSPRTSSTNKESEKLGLPQCKNCTVYVEKLSERIVAENLENMSEEVKDMSKKTSLKRKASPSKKKKSEGKRNLRNKPSPVKFSPRKRRARTCVPGTFKEPSLLKKLRRSK